MTSADRQVLLGEFIRAHRERLAPASSLGRRRTPGLRREELAERAGISATWCAWLEQGRPVRPSPEALGRLAAALGLTRAERAYLFDLAGLRDPKLAEAGDAGPDAPPSLVDAVAALSSPAYGLDPLWNACCWNGAAADLFEVWLGPGGDRNLIRYVCLDADARSLIPDWEARARRLVAEFRADFSRRLRDARLGALVEELRRLSPLFAEAWADQAVLDREGGRRGFDHPSQGRLDFEQHTFAPTERADYKLVLLVPAGG